MESAKINALNAFNEAGDAGLTASELKLLLNTDLEYATIEQRIRRLHRQYLVRTKSKHGMKTMEGKSIRYFITNKGINRLEYLKGQDAVGGA